MVKELGLSSEFISNGLYFGEDELLNSGGNDCLELSGGNNVIADRGHRKERLWIGYVSPVKTSIWQSWKRFLLLLLLERRPRYCPRTLSASGGVESPWRRGSCIISLPLFILSAFFRLGSLVVVDDGILTGRQRANIACSVTVLLLIVAHIRVDLDPNGRHIGTFI